MFRIHETQNCGIKELHGVANYYSPNGPKEFIRDMNSYFTGRIKPAHVVFSSTGSYGPNIADYIEANQLGGIVESPATWNPNTGNLLTAFIWSPNWTRVAEAAHGKVTPVKKVRTVRTRNPR